jgi:hypothetical protein
VTSANDMELYAWLNGAHAKAGDFLKAIAEAAFRADESNYAILRPALLELKAKYPKYESLGEEVPRS